MENVYKEMYFKLFNKVSDTIERLEQDLVELKEIQRKTEEAVISHESDSES